MTNEKKVSYRPGMSVDTPKRWDFLGLQPHLNAMSGDADAAVAWHYIWEVLAQNGVRHGCVGRDALMAPPKSRAWQSGPQR